MRHIKDARFKPPYDALPSHVRDLADKNFALLKQNPKHPSLHFKRLMGDVWSARVGRDIGHWPLRGRRTSDGSGSGLMLTTTGWLKLLRP